MARERWDERIPAEISGHPEIPPGAVRSYRDYGTHYIVVTRDGRKLKIQKRKPTAPPEPPETSGNRSPRNRGWSAAKRLKHGQGRIRGNS